ncbi:MAG: carbohydrate ABC transporter substrate-binding protein [Candidatus Dormibacteraeota bacterium]|nr:carbohydrate ABC transporter substrate-binding protein [Candidatus Dormibacteraeota bacterium]
MALVAAACGNSTPVNTSTQSSTTQPVTLHMLALGGAADAYWTQTVTDFQRKYPNITIQREVVNGSDFDAKWNAYIAARSGPDLVAIQAGAYWLAYKDALQPLNELRPDTANYNEPEMFCQDFDCRKNVYAVPYNLQGYVLYYNKSVLQSAGLDPNNPPRTWRAMAAACPQIQASGKSCWELGLKRSGGGILEYQLVQQTMTLAQQQGFAAGKTKWTDPEVVSSIQLFQDGVKRGWFNKDAPGLAHIGDAESVFESGKSAFIMGFVAEVLNYSVLARAIGSDNLGAMPVPQIEDGYPLSGVRPGPLSKLSAISSATAWGVPIWSKEKQAAMLWIRFAGDAANQGRMFQYSQPARKNLDSAAIQSPAFQQLQTLIQQSKGNLLAFYAGVAVYGPISQEFAKVFLGQETPDQAAQNLQKVADQGHP